MAAIPALTQRHNDAICSICGSLMDVSPCPDCGGTGEITQDEVTLECGHCHGIGGIWACTNTAKHETIIAALARRSAWIAGTGSGGGSGSSRGQGFVEYALIIVFLALVVAGAAALLGHVLATVFPQLAGGL